MKRTFAAAIAAVTASTSIWLASTEAATAQPRPLPGAMLRVQPRWTYQDGGKIAVIATCLKRTDLRLVTSKMLPRPVTLRKGGKLLIKLTHKTHPGKYTIMLSCMGKKNQIDAVDTQPVRILKLLAGFYQPDPPALPAHFKPDVTVNSGPPAPPRHKKKKKK